MLRAFSNGSCAVVDVEIRNFSGRPAFILTHGTYPHILRFTEATDIRLSLHELPAHRWLDPHHRSPQGVRVAAHEVVFLRMRLPLPLRVYRSNDKGFADEVVAPIFVRAAVGIVATSAVRNLEVIGALHMQGIAETESIRFEQRPGTEAACEPLNRHTFTRRDPAKGLRPSDHVFEF
jgi:hypothetical protein